MNPSAPARVLFTSAILRHPPVGGPSLRIENSIKALSHVAALHVVCRVPYGALGGAIAVRHFKALCRFRFSTGCGPLSSRLAAIANKRVRLPLRIVQRGVNAPFRVLGALLRLLQPRDEAELLITYARRHRIAMIWFGHGQISYPLIREIRRRAPELRLVCDTDSVWSRFILRELPFQRDPAKHRRIEAEGKAKEAEEREWVNLCDVTTAVSEVDAAYYRMLAQHPERIHLFSNAIDLHSYHEDCAAPAGFRRPCVYLSGTFWQGSPMEQAARWMVDEVMPRLRTYRRDVHLYIVGQGSSETLSDVKADDVTVVGCVDSVLSYLVHADVVAVPLMFESGTRFKILEAGACKKAVVSTTLGAEGLPVHDQHDILIADTADDFAEAIVRLLGDHRVLEGLGDRLFATVSHHATVETLSREARVILDWIANDARQLNAAGQEHL